MKRLFLTVGILLSLTLMFLAIPGCASLEPMPKFRTSSTSFAPDQLPVSQRSTSDLLNPSTVGAYSLVKEDALQKTAAVADIPADATVIRSVSILPLYTDVIGLDSELLEDEKAENEEFGAEEPPVEDAFTQKVVSRSFVSMQVDESQETNDAVNRVDLMKEIINLLGVRYRYGGMDAVRGIDCSAFVGTIYSRALGVRLPRSSNEQFGTGIKIKKHDLKVGDLVFFKTRRNRGPVSHVGIYVGQEFFAHASTKHGVIISNLSQGYYDKTFVGARRLLQSDLTQAGTK